MSETNLDQLDRIRKLLAKAERLPDTDPECIAIMERVTVLCTKYQIDRAQAQQSGSEPQETVSNILLPVTRPFRQRQSLVCTVYEHFDCSAVLIGDRVEVFGFQSNMTMAAMLLASLTVQGERKWAAWDDPVKKSHYLQSRRAFWQDYRNVIHTRLAATKKKVTDDEPGAALVLYDRSKAGESAMHQKYPKLRTSYTRAGNAAGAAAGRQAGREADIGQSRFATNKKELA
jgi:hypothetical protein